MYSALVCAGGRVCVCEWGGGGVAGGGGRGGRVGRNESGDAGA